jgi:predicted nuclease of predicted toxin-antitoxin system
MKLLLDECLPRKLENHLPGHECHTVPEVGWAGKKNGELLLLAEKSSFQIFLTLDRGMEYEQDLKGREITIILVAAKSSQLADLLPRMPAVLDVLRSVRAGQIVHVSD